MDELESGSRDIAGPIPAAAVDGGLGSAPIAEYLAERLWAHGVRHVFGRPGPFAAEAQARLAEAGHELVATASAGAVGVAADAYARMRGLGAVCVPYGADALRLLDAAARAYAERCPVVFIAGAPGSTDHERHPLATSGGAVRADARSVQHQAFAAVTVASARLDDLSVACREIERVLEAALAHKRPVYLELPHDLVDAVGPVLPLPRPVEAASSPPALAAALAEAAAMVAAAERPVIVLGVEVQRFGLQDHVLRLMAATGAPVAVTLLGKSVIGEAQPAFLGVYAGAGSRPDVRDAVEGSDCLLLLGAVTADLNPGGAPPRLDPARCVDATGDRLAIGYHRYERVRLSDFVAGLAATPAARRARPPQADGSPDRRRVIPQPGAADEPLGLAGLVAHLAAFLSDEIVVIVDPGAALLPAAELPIGLCSEFMAPASYGAAGFALSASLGVGLAEPELRPLVLVEAAELVAGPGELATAARLGLAPIVVALNPAPTDGGYRPDAHRLPELFGTGWGAEVATGADLDRALAQAARRTDVPCVIDVRLPGAATGH